MADDSLRLPALDEPGLVRLAQRLAPLVRGGGAIHLQGPLGAGKTTFARALLRTLGVAERVKSPTYTLIETYPLPDLVVHHLDLYRIAAPEELEWLGLHDLAAGRQLWLIEWPERGADAAPAADLLVQLAHAGAGRDVRLEAPTELGRRWLRDLQQVRPDS